jgi:hypothetical protein
MFSTKIPFSENVAFRQQNEQLNHYSTEGTTPWKKSTLRLLEIWHQIFIELNQSWSSIRTTFGTWYNPFNS